VSAVLERQIGVPRRQIAQPAPRVVPRRRRVRHRATPLAQVLALAGVGIVAFCVSSILARSVEESARREWVRSVERTRVARSSGAVLQSRLDAAVSSRSVEAWARSRGFLAAYGVKNPEQSDATTRR
jgi:hypothetical protein